MDWNIVDIDEQYMKLLKEEDGAAKAKQYLEELLEKGSKAAEQYLQMILKKRSTVIEEKAEFQTRKSVSDTLKMKKYSSLEEIRNATAQQIAKWLPEAEKKTSKDFLAEENQIEVDLTQYHIDLSNILESEENKSYIEKHFMAMKEGILGQDWYYNKNPYTPRRLNRENYKNIKKMEEKLIFEIKERPINAIAFSLNRLNCWSAILKAAVNAGLISYAEALLYGMYSRDKKGKVILDLLSNAKHIKLTESYEVAKEATTAETSFGEVNKLQIAEIAQIPVGYIIGIDSKADGYGEDHVMLYLGKGKCIHFNGGHEKGITDIMIQITERYPQTQNIYYARPPWLKP